MRVYNTLAGKKEEFIPAIPGRVGMYVCGVTVYDLCHVGHARSAIVFDVIRRYLSHRGYAVTYVRNFTDIDDKIIVRAREKRINWKTLAGNYIDEYYSDMDRLGVRRADVEPKATDFIREMEAIIGDLMEKGYAYRLPSGVYYRVRRFKDYGKLSKRDLEAMMSGARVEVDERKEDPLDFALWKTSAPDEPSWDTPWGGGRPGWHIECSAMSQKLLGETFDIHGGGMDLIFPHHENEIAQSEAHTGKPFVRYWIHNGFVNVNQEKMSKSLGNFFTIREIFEKSPYSLEITAEVLRYFLLSTHYRSPVDFSDAALHEAKAALDNFYTLFQKLDEAASPVPSPPEGERARVRGEGEAISSILTDFIGRFETAMDDDFNTAGALAEFQNLRKEINDLGPDRLSREASERVWKTFLTYGEVLGLFTVLVKEWSFGRIVVPEPVTVRWSVLQPAVVNDTTIQQKVAAREQARREKNWKRSDEIRDELKQMGVILEDRPDGTTRVKRG